MMKNIVIIFFIIICSNILHCQDIESDFARVNDTYSKISGLSMDIKYSVIDRATNKTLESMEGNVKKEGNKLYRKDGPITNISTDNYVLLVDEENEYIMLKPNKSQPINNEITPDFIAEGIKLCTDIQRVVLNNNKVQYILKYDNPDYEKIVIEIDTNRNFITGIILYNKEFSDEITGELYNVITQIFYTNINTNPKFSSKDFDYSRYLYKESDTYKLVGAYSTYKFINLIN